MDRHKESDFAQPAGGTLRGAAAEGSLRETATAVSSPITKAHQTFGAARELSRRVQNLASMLAGFTWSEKATNDAPSAVPCPTDSVFGILSDDAAQTRDAINVANSAIDAIERNLP